MIIKEQIQEKTLNLARHNIRQEENLINNIARREIVVEDGLDYKFVKNFGREFPNEDVLDFEIKRYLRTDYYGLRISFQTKENMIYRIGVQINNELVYESADLDSRTQNSAELFLQHHQLKKTKKVHTKFKDINHIVVSVHKVHQNKNIPFEIRQAIQLLLTHNKTKKDFLVEKEPIVFKTKKIIGTQGLIHNWVIFEPTPWSQFKNNTNLFNVFIWNENDEKSDFDLSFETKTLSGLTKEGKKMEVIFEKPKANEPRFKNKFTFLGTLKTLNNTYYDFQKNKTIVGEESRAESGFVISPFFSGSLLPKFTISFSSAFQNIELARNIEFPFPIFGPNKAYFGIEMKKGENFEFKKPKTIEIPLKFSDEIIGGKWNPLQDK